MSKQPTIQIKRAYEDVEKEKDGWRVLVDRLWPRGVSKQELQLDAWNKELAPSDKLRRWFDHDPEKFEEFSRRYRGELHEKQEAVQELLSTIREHCKATLVFAARDRDHNNAVVLKDYLERKL
ncbi:Uncharacterized conserved protein YeaO, DUF488 family [Fodinibius sediminis]|uniref:Uncharacterized conserved protein YeaO, DUF488 family n=2 Tax=Fodinibius sediminis TaxID=1214077 RepID=A0A521DB71_9BACT|nr:Uncharacterized conserved protein YeaO, DUF488 family [Fodinibius sediminis]